MSKAIYVIAFISIVIFFKFSLSQRENLEENCEQYSVDNCVPGIYNTKNANFITHMVNTCKSYCKTSLENIKKQYENEKNVYSARYCKQFITTNPELCITDSAIQKSTKFMAAKDNCKASCHEYLSSLIETYAEYEKEPNSEKKIVVVYARPKTDIIEKRDGQMRNRLFSNEIDINTFIDTIQNVIKTKTGKKFKIADRVIVLDENTQRPYGKWTYRDTDLFGDYDVEDNSELNFTTRQQLNDAIIEGLGGDTKQRDVPKYDYNPNDIYVVLLDGAKYGKFVSSCGFLNVKMPMFFTSKDYLKDFYKEPNKRSLKGATMCYVMLQGSFKRGGREVSCESGFKPNEFGYLHFVFVHELLHALGAIRPQYRCKLNKETSFKDGLKCDDTFRDGKNMDHVHDEEMDFLYSGGNVANGGNFGDMTFDENGTYGYKMLFLEPGDLPRSNETDDPEVPEIWETTNPTVNKEVCTNETYVRHPSCYFTA